MSTNMAYSAGEELDFDIHFPPPSGGIEPVVVLLGWAGCKERHLAKYSAIYENRCITMQYIAPTEDIFYSNQNLHTTAAKILDTIVDLNFTENPILFHVFSNGGGMIYEHISQFSSTRKYACLKIVGVIFDSLPAKNSYLTAARVMANTFQVNFFVSHILAAFIVMCWSVKNVLKLLWPFSKPTVDYWSYMYNENVKWPSLYLYSKADEITDYHYVESVIAHRKQMGATISSLCWEDSSHVQHLTKHRETYIHRCRLFLDECVYHTN